MVLNTNDLIYEKFEETKGVIRSRKSKKVRKYHGQKRKDKERNNGPHDTQQKTKDCVTWTPLKTTRGELIWSRIVSSSCSNNDTCWITLVTIPMISHEWGKDRIMSTTNGTYPKSFVTHLTALLMYYVLRINSLRCKTS